MSQQQEALQQLRTSLRLKKTGENKGSAERGEGLMCLNLLSTATASGSAILTQWGSPAFLCMQVKQPSNFIALKLYKLTVTLYKS